jgi:hypothetical protein
MLDNLYQYSTDRSPNRRRISEVDLIETFEPRTIKLRKQEKSKFNQDPGLKKLS